MRPRAVSAIALFADEYPGACAQIRITAPYKYLREKGYLFDHAPHHMMKTLVEKGLNPARYDVFVLPRLVDKDGAAFKLVKDLQATGRIVVWETDDDYTERHRQVLKEGFDAISVASACDAITTSTPYLASVMREYNDNVYVLENCIDVDHWAGFENARVAEGLTIGVGGTPTHFDDWKVIVRPLHQIMEEHPHVNAVFMGYKPSYFDDFPTTRILHTPYMPYEAYPFAVRQVDIGLAPLAPDDEFNLSKSAIKVLEYLSCRRRYRNRKKGGAAVIATDMPVYNRIVKNEETGILVPQTEEAWYDAMKRLVTDEELRWRMGTRGMVWVRKNRSIKQAHVKWLQAYQAIKRELQGELK